MAKYKFLSDEWVEAARQIREDMSADDAGTPHKVKMNQIITEVPFGEGTVHAHMDSSSGEMDMGLGHLEDPELTVTLDYDTAKAILVDGNPQAGMQAFMAGKVKVEGDMTKLMAMQQAPADPEAAATAEKVAQAIRDITED
ncbi:MAG: SCP2 sterol-binding domain-containing protein [Microthrixaceae bacterium]|nr:SCP2 sterol-binding domain-containing protein [Microthrixaceae bacterium]MCO5318772.1 SCP2 sterol-binding domain-containing protein [Microthrixaceae bacterium]